MKDVTNIQTEPLVPFDAYARIPKGPTIDEPKYDLEAKKAKKDKKDKEIEAKHTGEEQKAGITHNPELDKSNNAIDKSNNAIAKSNFAIAESIISSGKNVLSVLNQIADEMERKNKLDEYYRLIEEITTFEDELDKRGQLGPAYAEMNLNTKKQIILTDGEIKRIVCLLSREKLDQVKKISRLEQKNPLLYLEKMQDAYDVYIEVMHMCSIEGNITQGKCVSNIRIPATGLSDVIGKTVPLLVEKKTNSVWIELNGHKYRCMDQAHYWATIDAITNNFFDSSKTYSELLKSGDDTMNREEMMEVQLLKGKDMIKEQHEKGPRVYLQVTLPASEVMSVIESQETLTEEIVEFKGFLAKLNFDITLQNLRNLHNELRIFLRKVKIGSYIICS